MDIGPPLVDNGHSAGLRAPLSAPYVENHNPGLHRYNTKLPRLHWCAYKGDIQGVLQCITGACNLEEAVSLRNQHGRMVCGITALFLAAQRGHAEIVKLLVTNGACPVKPCFIQGSAEVCTPAEVASLNLHFKLSRWLKKAARARRKEDEVLALDDEDRMSQVSSRLARGLQRARSTYSMSAAPAAGAGGGMSISGVLARMSRGSRNGGAMSVDGGPSLSQLGYGREGPPSVGDAVEADPQRLAALNFMQNVDLAAFDPEGGDQPVVVNRDHGQGTFKKLVRRIISWGGKDVRSDGPVSQGAQTSVRASASTRVRGLNNGVSGGGLSYRGGLGVDYEDPTRPDHTKVLQRFLKDLDLAHWRPEHDGPLERTTIGGSSTRPASPGRGRASPPRSARGNTSPARSRA
ncbi:hypothetical protein Vafri_20472 [Volvox africanus]|uniref:ANK_REP_REGION domain-containing protein n=1 Tax=Volvox africanus TaxID=51714 RepID=A0A8J4BQU0_9CHLO|nr:hypothetical protein Vafri_20472 [Volvox africanus]